MFHCVQCGCCCRNVRLHPDLVSLAKLDGSCIHLQENMQCAIYAERPDACRIDKAYEIRGSVLPREDYDRLTALACLCLMEQYGAPREKQAELLAAISPAGIA